MVKINNPINTHWRDSTDGYTGKANWSGPNGRNRMSPVSIHTGFKGLYKSLFSQLCNQWHDLSIAQRVNWGTFSDNNPSTDRYGNSILIGGFQWFIRLNTRLMQSSQSPIITPPPNATPSYNPSLQAQQNAGDDSLELAISPTPGSGEAVFWASALNVPFSQAKPVSTFKTGGFFDSSSISPYTMATADQILSTDLRFKFRFYSIDGFGRSPGLVYDDLVNVTKAP